MSAEQAVPLLRTVHLGFGPIGRAVYEAILRGERAHPVAIVDIDEARVRAELAARADESIEVVTSLSALEPGSADLVIQCTGSRLAAVAGQVEEALAWGASVLSTCEELSFPWMFNLEHATRIHAKAEEANRVVLATGVNPGFAMDSLPMLMSLVTDGIREIHVRRIVDASKRREPLQRKIGVGISRAEFERRKKLGSIGHVGLRESVAMMAAGVGLPVDRVTSELNAVIDDRNVVAGIKEVALGWADSAPVIRLELQMYIDATDESDTIVIQSDAPLEIRVRGLRGDAATATIVAKLARSVTRLKPGLRTMVDVLNVA